MSKNIAICLGVLAALTVSVTGCGQKSGSQATATTATASSVPSSLSPAAMQQAELQERAESATRAAHQPQNLARQPH